MAEDAAFTASIFPPPPGEWGLFTASNLDLRARLAETTTAEEWAGLSPSERLRRQEALLQGARVDGYALVPSVGTAAEDAEAPDALDANPDAVDLLLDLSAPRADWIVDEGRYACLGAVWPIQETLPPLHMLAAAPGSGISQLYPSGLPPGPGGEARPLDKRDALVSLLRSLLVAHYELVGVLTAPPREYVAHEAVPVPPGAPAAPARMAWRSEAVDLAAFVRNVAVNMQHLVNEMRAPQAHADAEAYLRAQLERRRAQTHNMRRTCTSIRASIASMRAVLADTHAPAAGTPADVPMDDDCASLPPPRDHQPLTSTGT